MSFPLLRGLMRFAGLFGALSIRAGPITSVNFTVTVAVAVSPAGSRTSPAPGAAVVRYATSRGGGAA